MFVRVLFAAAFLMLAIALALGPAGCKGAPEQATRDKNADAVVKRSGGDWDHLSPAEREALVRDLGKGDARTAQMNFQARWSRIKGGGVPPNPATMRPAFGAAK